MRPPGSVRLGGSAAATTGGMASSAPGVMSGSVPLYASEAAAVEQYLNASLWPSCVLVGLDLTSRRGQAKLAERRAASEAQQRRLDDAVVELREMMAAQLQELTTVSYTHLTLPTKA